MDYKKFKERRLTAVPKITLLEVSELTGLSVSGIKKIEDGYSENPGIYTIQAIDEALDLLERERALEPGEENKSQKAEEESEIKEINEDIELTREECHE